VVVGSGTTFVNDQLKRGVEVFQHVAGSNAERSNSRCLEAGVSTLVALRSVAEIMCGAIDLDAQPRRFAVEVEHIGSGGMLPAEFESLGA